MGSTILTVQEAADIYVKTSNHINRHIEKVNAHIRTAAGQGKTYSLTSFADIEEAHIVADRYRAAGYTTSVERELNIKTAPVNLKITIPNEVIQAIINK